MKTIDSIALNKKEARLIEEALRNDASKYAEEISEDILNGYYLISEEGGIIDRAKYLIEKFEILDRFHEFGKDFVEIGKE